MRAPTRTTIGLIGVCALALPCRALAATIDVTTTADEKTGGNGCSLREAVLAANADSKGGDGTDGADGGGVRNGPTTKLSLTRVDVDDTSAGDGGDGGDGGKAGSAVSGASANGGPASDGGDGGGIFSNGPVTLTDVRLARDAAGDGGNGGDGGTGGDSTGLGGVNGGDAVGGDGGGPGKGGASFVSGLVT